MGVVMWSAYFPSTPTIRVRIPLKPTVFSVKCVFETNENKQKRRVLAQKEIYLYLLKKSFITLTSTEDHLMRKKLLLKRINWPHVCKRKRRRSIGKLLKHINVKCVNEEMVLVYCFFKLKFCQSRPNFVHFHNLILKTDKLCLLWMK